MSELNDALLSTGIATRVASILSIAYSDALTSAMTLSLAATAVVLRGGLPKPA